MAVTLKTRPSSLSASARPCFGWDRESTFRKLASLGDAREAVLEAYRRRGGTSGWRPADVAVMAQACTEVEDALELVARPSAAQRAARVGLRELRLQLEVA